MIQSRGGACLSEEILGELPQDQDLFKEVSEKDEELPRVGLTECKRQSMAELSKFRW